MQLIGFSATGWESWDVAQQPLIRDRMPVLIDDDLRFEDAPGVPPADGVRQSLAA